MVNLLQLSNILYIRTYMSGDNIEIDELETDSTIGSLEIAKDKDKNWYLKKDSSLVNRDLELIDIKNIEDISAFQYNSVIKAQQLAQEFSLDKTDEASDNEDEDNELSEADDEGSSLVGGIFSSKDEDKSETETYDVEEKDDNEETEDSILDRVGSIFGGEDDEADVEDEPEKQDELVKNTDLDSLEVNGDDGSDEESEEFGEKETTEDSLFSGFSLMGSSDNEEENESNQDEEVSEEENESEESDYDKLQEESSDNNSFKEDVLGFFVKRNTDDEGNNVDDEALEEQDKDEEDAEGSEDNEKQFVSGNTSEDDDEQEDNKNEGSSIFESIFGSDDENTESSGKEEEESRSLIESVKLFFSTEIASVDQDRPDAQNVSIDFIQNSDTGYTSYEWSDTMDMFWTKLSLASEGDEATRRDIYTDLRTRYWALIKSNSYARGDILDTLFTLTLTFMGAFIVLLGLSTIFVGDIAGLEVLTQVSSYGDHIFITTVLLGLASISFWLSRRASSKTLVSAIRKPARVLSGGILLLQLTVVVIVGYALLFGAGQETLLNLESSMDDTVQSLAPSDGYIIGVYESYRGPDVSLFGFSIVQASIFMTFIGMITAYPVMKRSIARFILTANMNPREFREKTGILIGQISDEEEEMATPDYVMGGVGEIEEGLDIEAEQRQQYEVVSEGEEAAEELLALPEHIKGSPFADYEEVRRYWVRAPYAYVSIVYNERQNDYRYVVVEPELDESEEVIFDELQARLDNVLLFEDVEEREDYEEEQEIKLKKLEKKMIQLSQEYDMEVNDKTFHKLMYFVERDYIYFNKIDPLINDPNVEDISCDGENKYIFVFHSDYKDVITTVKFQKEQLRSFIQELAQRSGEHISAADPMVDASLPDGSRAQMTLGSEVTTEGSTFTIRLFEEIPFTPVDLLGYDTFSLSQMAYLWTAIEHNKSLIFAGGTASGKTTSMNAVSMFIPPKAKVITIEDTREISLPQENWIPGTTREGLGEEDGGDIDMYELLRAALRQRPEYIVVGEIRGREAETLFQAMNTGHTTYSTMHAETVKAAVGRLTNPPINVPKQMITALDIICIQNQIRFTDDNGNVQNVRRNEETREIVSLRDNGQFQNKRPFQWDAETDTFIKSLEESHVLQRIADENGWNEKEMYEQLNEREEVLEYMLEENIREFEYVTNIIQAYMVDSENVIRKVRNDELDPSELKSLTDMEFQQQPNQTLNEMATDDSANAGDMR